MIQLSRMKGWDPIIRFNLTTYLCKSQARTIGIPLLGLTSPHIYVSPKPVPLGSHY
jgi:hypothetical protein